MIKMVSQANGKNMDCSIANAGATQQPIGRKKKIGMYTHAAFPGVKSKLIEDLTFKK